MTPHYSHSLPSFAELYFIDFSRVVGLELVRRDLQDRVMHRVIAFL